MQKKILTGLAVALVLGLFVFLAWKQGVWTLPNKTSVQPTQAVEEAITPPEQGVACWSEGNWYKPNENYLKDNNCTICVCNGSIKTMVCVRNPDKKGCPVQ